MIFIVLLRLWSVYKEWDYKKVSKGVFYIPRKTIFGELGPDSNGILERYLFEDGKRVAYETGFSLYNRMGLTTQMAFKIKIATKKNPININQGTLQVSSVKSYVDITEKKLSTVRLFGCFERHQKNPRLLSYTGNKANEFLLKSVNLKGAKELIQYALFYPARVRSLLGAILENLNVTIQLEELKSSLNPLTKINISIKATELPTVKNWNIE